MLRSCTRFIDKHKNIPAEIKYLFYVEVTQLMNQSLIFNFSISVYLSIYQSTYAKKKNTLVSGNAGYEKIFTRECTTLYFSINLIGSFNSTFLFYLLLFKEKKRHFHRINLLGENRLNSKF